MRWFVFTTVLFFVADCGFAGQECERPRDLTGSTIFYANDCSYGGIDVFILRCLISKTDVKLSDYNQGYDFEIVDVVTSPNGVDVTHLLVFPNFTQYIAVGQIDDSELNEASGLAASRKFQDILYTHNDHGDRPRLFAINATNAHVVATLEISPAKHNDWEDLAVGPCSDGSSQTCIYVLDDGRYHGTDMKTVYKIAEPDAMVDQTLTPDSVLKYNWTEPGSNTLMVDPMGEVYIIANVYGGRGMIVNLPKSAWGQTNPVFVESGSFYAMYSSSHTDPEGGDISPDGSEILIKIANHMYYYTPVNMDFITALTHPGVEVPYHRERLGEAVCWSADGKSYYTLGEATAAVLYRYDKQ